MMTRLVLLIAGLAAAPALAQTTPPAAPPAGPVGPPPEFITAAQAFGQCVGKSAGTAPAATTPEAAAKQSLVTCAAERTAMDTRFDAWVASPGFPEAGRASAREQYKAQMSGVETQIATKIREGRASAAAPKPNATPTPTK
jgi:hypothetical protein